MPVIRAFIAIDLASEIRQKLEEISSDLKSHLKQAPVRWVAVDGIHLTLKFLGDVSLSNLDMLKKILQGETSSHTPFDISVGKLGAFPSAHRPRVIWVGVEGPAQLNAIQRGIETETSRLGYAREERPFSPHLTLGRVSRNATPSEVRAIGEAIEKIPVGLLGVMQVEEVNLYRSDLLPGGAVYTRLFSAPLRS